jgi:hypothetical protein
MPVMSEALMCSQSTSAIMQQEVDGDHGVSRWESIKISLLSLLISAASTAAIGFIIWLLVK